MRATLLVVLLGCLMGALLALVAGPQEGEDAEFVSEEPLVPE